nr:hypothetical protein [Vagococcus coleopterorum]
MPKALKVENAANILKIEFDNGEIKYLQTHYISNMKDAFSVSKGKGKRKNLLVNPTTMWIGCEIDIKPDGTVTINENDHYTPEELWHDSKSSVTLL